MKEKVKKEQKGNLKKLSLNELQFIYSKVYGQQALEIAIENRFKKYDYIVRLEERDKSQFI